MHVFMNKVCDTIYGGINIYVYEQNLRLRILD